MGAQGVDEGIGLSVVDERVAFDLHPLRQGLEIDGNLRRQIFFQALVHQKESRADRQGRNGYTDQKSHLLPERCCAHQVAGLQVLRSGAGDGGGDANNAANHQRQHLIIGSSPAGHEKDGAGGHQRGDAHAADGIRGIAEQAADTSGHSDKQKSEDNNKDSGEQILPPAGLRALHGMKRQEYPHHDDDYEGANDNYAHGHIAINAIDCRGFAGAFGADIFQPGAQGGNDRGQGAQQGDQPRRSDGARAHGANVGAPDLVGRHFRDRNRGWIDRRVAGKLPVKTNGWHDDQPGDDTSRKEEAGDARTNDVADAEIFRGYGGTKRSSLKP